MDARSAKVSQQKVSGNTVDGPGKECGEHRTFGSFEPGAFSGVQIPRGAHCVFCVLRLTFASAKLSSLSNFNPVFKVETLSSVPRKS